MAAIANQNGCHMVQHPWKQKRGVLNKFWIPIIKLHETL
jgi:hypothetical protein